MTSELRALVVFGGLTLGALAPFSMAHAAGSPAMPVPSDRWGTLQPAGILGDSTAFAGHSDPVRGNVREYFDVDIENGYPGISGSRKLRISPKLLACFNTSPLDKRANEPVSFDGSCSVGNPDSYLWDFGDHTVLGRRPATRRWRRRA